MPHDTLKCLKKFRGAWGQHWPFVADFDQVRDEHLNFMQSDLPDLLRESGKARPEIKRFVDKVSLDYIQNRRGYAAYFSMFTYLSLAYRRPYVETDPEKLAAAPVQTEQEIGFPSSLSKFWSQTGHNLGIAPVPSLSALLYCNVSCDLADTPPSSSPAQELERLPALIEYQRKRFTAAKIQFCNHPDPDDRAMFESFVKIFLYSEMAGNRVYHWAECALKAFCDNQDPDAVVDNLEAMQRWATEALTQYFELDELPKAALAGAQFTPGIKLNNRQGAPGVTGVLIPFLDEFFGFTTVPSTYLEKVRKSRPFLLPEPAEMIESCQANSPYQYIFANMPTPRQRQLEALRTALKQTLSDWRSRHRRHVGRFFATGITSESETPHMVDMTRDFMTDMAERISAFEREP